MKTVRILQDPNGGVTVPCPAGKEVRVVAYTAALTVNTPSDCFIIEYFQSNQLLAQAVSPPMSSGATRIDAGIGATPAGMILTDPAGTIGGPGVSMGLYDIWFPFEIIIRGTSVISAVPLATIVLYEERDAS